MRAQVFTTSSERRGTPWRASALSSIIQWTATVLTAAGVLSSLGLHGQGTVRFQNSVSSLVTDCTTVDPCAPVPVGSLFSVGLYYAPDGEPEPYLLLGPPTFIYPIAGYFLGGTRTTPIRTPPGDYAMFRVKVWETAFGTTYEEALNAPPQGGRYALLGTSNLMRVRTGVQGSVPPSLPLQPIYVGDCGPYPPDVLIFYPRDVTATVGSSVVFQASASAMACYVYGWEWYHNGVAIFRHTNSVPWDKSSAFGISRIQVTNAGAYSVVATNAYGAGLPGVGLLRVVVALNLSSYGSGTVQAEPNHATYAPFTNVVITAIPAPDHELLNWSGDATGNANPFVVLMDTNKTIAAHFALKPRLEILGPSQTAGERLRLTGETGVIYTVEQSENLEVWKPFLTVTNLTGKVDFDGPALTNRCRFFKAVRFP